MQKIRVFADTNVILESFRTSCWTAISNHFAIETVEKCVEETLTGNPGDPRHVAVPPAVLNAGLAVQHPVSRKELATLVLSHPPSSTLDDGEKHLFAWLFANKLLPSHVIVVTTADKAALVASNGLGWLDCMISLEDLARKAGVGRVNLDALALQYRDDWLSSIKTKIRLGTEWKSLYHAGPTLSCRQRRMVFRLTFHRAATCRSASRGSAFYLLTKCHHDKSVRHGKQVRRSGHAGIAKLGRQPLIEINFDAFD